jgi:hypothetical protein
MPPRFIAIPVIIIGMGMRRGGSRQRRRRPLVELPLLSVDTATCPCQYDQESRRHFHHVGIGQGGHDTHGILRTLRVYIGIKPCIDMFALFEPRLQWRRFAKVV